MHSCESCVPRLSRRHLEMNRARANQLIRLRAMNKHACVLVCVRFPNSLSGVLDWSDSSSQPIALHLFGAQDLFF